MHSKEVLAYAAGIIDGEGCVQYIAHRPKDRIGVRGYVRVSVGNTDLRLIGWLYEHFEGHVTSRPKQKQAHKQSYDWVIASNKAIEFLKTVIPYMVIKKERSQYLVENAIALRHSTRHSVEFDRGRLELKERMHLFNRKGEPPATTKRDGGTDGTGTDAIV